MSTAAEELDELEPAGQVVRFGRFTPQEAAARSTKAKQERADEREAERVQRRARIANTKADAEDYKADANELASLGGAVVAKMLLDILSGAIPVTNAATAEKVARMGFEVAQVSLGKPTSISAAGLGAEERARLIKELEERARR